MKEKKDRRTKGGRRRETKGIKDGQKCFKANVVADIIL